MTLILKKKIEPLILALRHFEWIKPLQGHFFGQDYRIDRILTKATEAESILSVQE
jgi:hypothetical protein